MGLVDAAYEFIEDFGAGTGDGFAGVGAGFHPCEEENKRDPAVRIVFDCRADSVESEREAMRHIDGGELR